MKLLFLVFLLLGLISCESKHTTVVSFKTKKIDKLLDGFINYMQVHKVSNDSIITINMRAKKDTIFIYIANRFPIAKDEELITYFPYRGLARVYITGDKKTINDNAIVTVEKYLPMPYNVSKLRKAKPKIGDFINWSIYFKDTTIVYINPSIDIIEFSNVSK